MRITREMLLKIANDTVTRRANSNRDLMAAFLCGSLQGDDYLLGGTADIDLVLIYAESPAVEREIQRLTDEIHLDIANHFHRDYSQTRRLRVHPWLGPALNSCKVLYDPQHFLDFTQASVRGQFDRPDHVLERARSQVEQARQIWFSYQMKDTDAGPVDVLAYLRAVGFATNGIASLNGPPLTERRFLSRLPERVEALGRPGLYPAVLGLLGAPKVDAQLMFSWLPSWQSAYQSAPAQLIPPRLHPDRLNYYGHALGALLSGSQPETALWPLLVTWTLAAIACGRDSPAREPWRQACDQLSLVGDGFVGRLEALDAFLDLVDETLEDWAKTNGA
jgi:hypothetical protein